MKWWDNPHHAEQRRMIRGLHSTGRDLERKFWPAMVLYAILAVAIWLTFGEGTVFVSGKKIQLRLIPLFVVGMFVFRTVMAHEADKIRHRDER